MLLNIVVLWDELERACQFAHENLGMINKPEQDRHGFSKEADFIELNFKILETLKETSPLRSIFKYQIYESESSKG
jgi:hypothetical protein